MFTENRSQLVLDCTKERTTYFIIISYYRNMKIDHYESARRGLVPVSKILSSTYCILVIAIYVVIVVNRFTIQNPPESHHDVEVSHQ